MYQEALTATVSHEQMTPLNSILNLTDLIKEESQESLNPDSDIVVISKTTMESWILQLQMVFSSATMMQLMNKSLLDLSDISGHSFEAQLMKVCPMQKISEVANIF